MSPLGREHDLPNGRFVEAKLGSPAPHPTAALDQPVGRVWVESDDLLWSGPSMD